MSRVLFDKRKYHIGMIIRQGFSFKLKPDGAQDRKMSRFAGCTRWVYNQGLAWNEERRAADPAFHLSYAKLCTELLVWKSRGHQGNADVVAAINIKERGRSSLACGESEKNAQAQVNSGRSKRPTPNQQQESTEVISNASC